MGNRFLGLRHHAVVCRDNNNGNIRHLSTACTHRRKGLVARSIQERDMSAVFKRDIIRTNVLRDTACLARNDRCLADIIQQ